MSKIMTILTEVMSLCYCEVLIKTDDEFNKVTIYNEIRALPGVVVVNVEQNQYLTNRNKGNYEYSLLKIKYISKDTPENDIKKINMMAKSTYKIKGLLQFIPRIKTIKKLGVY